MAKVFDGVVVSDILFSEYHKFRNGGSCNTDMIKRLLHYYKHEIVSNIGQYEKNNVSIEPNLKVGLARAGLKKQTLEDLAENNTIYKIILSTERNDFPYINIMNDDQKLENNFSSSFDISEKRKRAFEHLTAICKHAKKITVYDKYFSNGKNNVSVLERIFPQKKLDIHYNYDSTKDKGINDADILALKAVCSDWTFIKDNYVTGRHDRYLIIDDRLEVILSSGFDHLNDDSGDLTYIIRPVKSPRF